MTNKRKLMTRDDAAIVLDVNPRTVARFAERGLLGKITEKHKITYKRSDVHELKRKLELRESVGDAIKEWYAMVQCRVPIETITSYSGIQREELSDTLFVYSVEREGVFRACKVPFGFYDCLLLSSEAAMRLKITDGHLIPSLIEKELIKADTFMVGKKKKYFVNLESFKSYLGKEYVGQLLYRSSEVLKKTGKSIEHIDRIARAKGIGFKIKPTMQGNYLFTEKDIAVINRINGNDCKHSNYKR